MANFYASYPFVGGGGVTIFATFASFTAGTTAGQLAVAADTGNLYEWTGSVWQQIAGPGAALGLGNLDAQAATAKGAALVSGVLSMQSADATHPGLLTTASQTLAGSKTFSSLLNADGGIDRSTSGTLTIGATNSSIINIGNSGATVNIQGTTIYENTPQLLTADPLITVNHGGGVGSGQNAGIQVEEASSITGYNETSSDRNSWILKAPNTAGIATITPGAGGITLDQSSHNPVTLGTANGLSLSTQVLSLALSSTSTTGALSSTDWNTFNGKQAAGNYITALTGDATASGPGSAALTLATVNTNTGSFGSATQVAGFTVNGKGLITAAANTSIQIAESQVTNLVSDLASKQTTVLTSAHLLVGNVSNQATDVAMTGDVNISNTGATSLVATTNSSLTTLSGLTTASSLATVGTITSGTWNGTAVDVTHGGTGRASLTTHGVLVGAGTSGVTQLAAADAGTLLAGAGASADPAFSATPTLGINASVAGTLSLANGGGSGASVTIQNNGATAAYNFNLPTTAGTSGQPLLSGGGASAAMTFGTLSVGAGGTGKTSFAVLDGLICSGTTATSACQQVAAGSNSTQYLNYQGVGALPIWAQVTSLGTVTAGTWNGTKIGVNFGGTNITSYGTGDLLYASAFQTLSSRAIGSTGNVLTVSGGVPVWAPPATSGTVTSVALSDASTSPIYAVSGSPVTGTGTLTLTLGTQTANTIFAGPTTGAAAQPTFRAVVAADIPTLNQNTTGTASDITASSNTSLTSLVNLATVGTIGTGTWNGSTISVSHGGTGAASQTAYAVLCGGTTSTGAVQSVASVGSSGQVLTSNGAGALPTFQASAANTFYGARYNSSSSSLSGAYAKVTYTTKNWDIDNAYASGTYTVPSTRTGYYQVQAGIQIDCVSVVVGNSDRIAIYKNGVIQSENIVFYTSTSVLSGDIEITDILNVTTGDTIEIFALSSGGTPTIAAVASRVFVNFHYLGA